ncbi:MAG TPA: hypothetical protein PLV44_11680 [Myxococcota bacterium]|nr:hypothetical protein [Myxococcota bacterium]
MDTEQPLTVNLSKMSDEAVLKMLELEWQDHFQTRKQTWQALQTAVILTVALVGLQWSSKEAIQAIVGVFAAPLVIGVSAFGMQITLRHRNSTEVNKFTMILAAEERLKFESSHLKIPQPISLRDVLRFRKSNTSLFLLRMQGIIHLTGWLMLVFSIVQLVAPAKP